MKKKMTNVYGCKKRVKGHDLCLASASAFTMIWLGYGALRYFQDYVKVSKAVSPLGCNIKLTAES